MIKRKSLISVIILLTFVFLITIVLSNDIVKEETLSRYGSSGSEVKQIQTKLKNWGYYNRKYRWNLWK